MGVAAVLAGQPRDGLTGPVDAGWEEDDDLAGVGGRPPAQLGREPGGEGGGCRGAHGLGVDDGHGGDGVQVDADGPSAAQQARLVGVGGEQGVDELAARTQLGLGHRPLGGHEHRHGGGADPQQPQGLLVVLGRRRGDELAAVSARQVDRDDEPALGRRLSGQGAAVVVADLAPPGRPTARAP